MTDIQQQLANGQYAQRKAFSKPKWTGRDQRQAAGARSTPPRTPCGSGSTPSARRGCQLAPSTQQRKNGSVVIYDSTLTEVARWNFYNAWPSKISNDSFTVGGNDPISETVTVQYEKLERTK